MLSDSGFQSFSLSSARLQELWEFGCFVTFLLLLSFWEAIGLASFYLLATDLADEWQCEELSWVSSQGFSGYAPPEDFSDQWLLVIPESAIPHMASAD
jgi:hypothetical protein